MLKKILVLTVLLASTQASYATDLAASGSSVSVEPLVATKNKAEPFPNLKTLAVDEPIVSEGESIAIHYNPSVTEVINEELSDPDLEGQKRMLKTKIDKESDQYYTIDYSPGPSADPVFIIQKNEGKALAKTNIRLSGLQLYIPGNGFLYVSGHTNNMFNARRKYKVEGDELVEVEQPFYYVGIDAELKKDLEIYSDIGMKKSLGLLTKGTGVSVLVNQEDNYLVKSSFGLVGWAKIPESLYPGEVVDGIYYAGD
ncbi:MAG: hypothetical protein E6Q83_01705 [Thiothrix sp.]|nr:MAG: hypothetical protein E6Q83_01705 [Thiothrix sp.]